MLAKTETEAWLHFLGSDDPRDIFRLTDRFPMFRQLYQEIIDFRYHPKELISMYSDALRILDQNTVKYMIDELKGQVAELARQKAESDAALAKQDAELAKQIAENQQLRQQLAKYEGKSAE